MLRPFHPDDTEQILRIWYEASIIAHDFMPDDFWATERETIRRDYIPIAETYVYEIDGRITGFISILEPNIVGGLFVDPAMQRQGAGRALIEYAAALKGTLTLNVFEQNQAARVFYTRMGFIEKGKGVDDHTGKNEILLLRPA